MTVCNFCRSINVEQMIQQQYYAGVKSAKAKMYSNIKQASRHSQISVTHAQSM